MRALRKEYGYKINDYKKYIRESNKKSGEEAQVDMGEYMLKDLENNPYKVYFFSIVLSFSRYKYVYFSSVKFDARLFIYAHDNAFRYFGGRPKIIRFDQDRVNIVSENAGDIVMVKEFEKYHKEVGFEIYLCKGEDTNTKGKIENVIKFVKTSFLDSRTYYGIDNLNLECLKWHDRTGNGMISSATYKVPRDVFIKDEAKHLSLYDHERITLTEQRIVRVTSLNDILNKCNFYALPLGRYNDGDKVRIEENEGMLFIYDITSGELVVSHKVLKGKGNKAILVQPKTLPKIFYSLKEDYKRTKCVPKFLNNMASSYPRYVTEQCRLLVKTFKTYNKADVFNAIRRCNQDDKVSISDVLSILIVKYGLDKAKDILSKRSSGYYFDKATILSKYDMLVDNEPKDGDKHE